ncbi:hypothetical protein JM93_03168 [Roseibium hamelinense]|uniref:ABC-type transport auxiliary lipoprotein component domain-containing protein n=1 Tax=Roseibium hamelinense TaxID=150831 RepID=A0A562SU49_9HYPH|nr:PqiC family protein [Roseibium hamelinense]MTI42526.1 membrane integrity-associated transporter subunit PqiC [Roseibium hamelinense]TWI84831.1 hypothetical protein JM93_03168 [Roseibium hamelinense]
MILKLLVASLALSGLMACVPSAPPSLFLVEAHTSSAAQPKHPKITRVGLLAVKLPTYARSEKIASRTNSNQIVQDDNNRWAEPPEEAVTRTLSASLEHKLSADVTIEPLPRGLDPSLRVAVRFDRFLRTPTGGVEMTGQYALQTGDGRDVVDLQRFSINVPSKGTSYDAFFEAVSTGLTQLGDQIARSALSRQVVRKL